MRQVGQRVEGQQHEWAKGVAALLYRAADQLEGMAAELG
jgi:hypothetical protein